MRRLLFSLYIKWGLFIEKICNYMRFFQFMFYLNNTKCFESRMFNDILKVIKGFISTNYPTYKGSIKMSRTVTESAKLLSSLIDTYLEEKSDIVLNQVMEVLKNEFIKRENEVNNNGKA